MTVTTHNLSKVTSTVVTFAIFAISGQILKKRMVFLGMFIAYLCTIIYMPVTNYSLFITMKLKYKFSFCVTTVLFYILKKVP
jgi:hypothetical protein